MTRLRIKAGARRTVALLRRKPLAKTATHLRRHVRASAPAGGLGPAPSSVPHDVPQEFAVHAEDAGARVDQFLVRALVSESRARIQNAISQARVWIGGRPVAKSGEKVRQGDVVRVVLGEPKPCHAAPEAMALDIRYEDTDIIVLAKAAGVVVHPAAGHHSGTLVNGLLHHTASLALGGGATRPGIVHRLDKDTTGLLVVAKTEEAHRSLSQQLQARDMRRVYVAWVLGTGLSRGSLSTPYGRHPHDRTRFSSKHGGSKHAVTHYDAVLEGTATTVLVARLETGRTHQIRVHMADHGHPLVGDLVYGRPLLPQQRGVASTEVDAARGLRRQALHAAALSLLHPRSGERLYFVAPLPEDLSTALERALGPLAAASAERAADAWAREPLAAPATPPPGLPMKNATAQEARRWSARHKLG